MKLSYILGLIASLLTLCQWFVFRSIKKYVFHKNQKIRRVAAYPLLMIFGIISIFAIRLEFGSELLTPGTTARQIVSIMVFSYLGWILFLTVFFMILRAMDGFSGLIREFKKPSDQPVVHPWRSDQRGSILVGSGQNDNTVSPPNQKSQPPPLLETSAGSPFQVNRRSFFKTAGVSGLFAATGFGIEGIREAYGEPVVGRHLFRHHRVQGIGQITLIHVTDWHFGMFLGPRELSGLVERINRVDGDAVCITGDIFHSGRSVVEQAVPLLKRLKARSLGNFAVLGNHDFYAGVEKSVESLEAAGIRILRNEWVTFELGNSRIHLAGIDDPMSNSFPGPGFMECIMRSPRKLGLRIMLSHRPGVFPYAARNGIDLLLAGHLHGGQLVFPLPWQAGGISVADLVSPYSRGWYKHDSGWMYLNPGVGLTFLPWRFCCFPEIAVIDLAPMEGQGSQGTGAIT